MSLQYVTKSFSCDESKNPIQCEVFANEHLLADCPFRVWLVRSKQWIIGGLLSGVIQPTSKNTNAVIEIREMHWRRMAFRLETLKKFDPSSISMQGAKRLHNTPQNVCWGSLTKNS